MSSKNIVVITGAAGFVGFHLLQHYHCAGFAVMGIDYPKSFNEFDIRHKRMAVLNSMGIQVKEGDLSRQDFVESCFAGIQPHLIFHLAAYADARSTDAIRFRNDNMLSFINVLSAVQHTPPAHFLFASSSAVYGEHSPRPFSESTPLSKPENSLYGASKLMNEEVSHYWADTFPVTGLRFFNIYGPWGRTQMAPFYFVDCLAQSRKINMITRHAQRTWLYIDDAVDVCVKLADRPPRLNEARFINIAGPDLVTTSELLDIIANLMNQTPDLVDCPPEIPEVSSNPADTSLLQSIIGYTPQITFVEGIRKFLAWYENEWLSEKLNIQGLKNTQSQT